MSYQICKRCVMDNLSDKTITFDDNGYCDYCSKALGEINTTVYFPGESGKAKLSQLLSAIKEDGKGKKYDCAMGISGGLDSSYLAYLGYKWGLRILAVHIDDGFDTEISKNNIEKLCRCGNIDLKVIKPDAVQFNALTKAYLCAGVPNVAAPQDSVLFAFLYREIRKEGLHYFLSGGNFALESILQRGNTHGANDAVNIRDIAKKFSEQPINKLKFFTTYAKAYYTLICKIKTVRPLNYIDYNREQAFRELKEFCDFEYYGSKHLENALTAFIQLYWFPNKFRVDKRKSHLSSMIVSGQMTRESALQELAKPMCGEAVLSDHIEQVKQQLGISEERLFEIMNSPAHNHTDYKVDKIEPIIRECISRGN